MADFVPPFPPRPAKPLSIVEMVRRGSTNFLTIFEARAFEYQTMSMQALTQQVFICNSPESVAEAFVHKQDNFSRKSPQMRAALAPLAGEGLSVSDGETWAARRPAVQTALEKYRRHHLPAVLRAVEQLQREWGAGAEVDMVEAMGRHSARMLGLMLFGPVFTDEDGRALREALAEIQAGADHGDLKQLLGLPGWLPSFGHRSTHGAVAKVHAVFDRLIGAVPADAPSLARSLQNGAGLTGKALRDELITLFLGGYDTVASLLAWVLYLLSQAPEVEERVLAELASAIGDSPLEAADLKALTFTRAVVSEALRLYPPVPLLTRQAQKADTIRDRKVAAGALVVVVPWLLHRHREFWDAPDAFRPDRFMPDAERKIRRYSFIPFSAGPRECPASLLGLSEAVITLVAVLPRFSFRLKPGAVVEPIGRHTILPGPSLPMRVSPRGNHAFAAPAAFAARSPSQH